MLGLIPILFCSVFGVGFIPFAPGTFGSLVGMFLARYLYFSPNFRIIITALLLLLVLLSLPLVKNVLKNPPQKWGAKNRPDKAFDPSYVVIDEVIGQLLTILIVSFAVELTTYIFSMCFFAFRVFDILKPWPIRQIELFFDGKEKYRPAGIVIDDVIAGVLAGLILIGASKFLL